MVHYLRVGIVSAVRRGLAPLLRGALLAVGLLVQGAAVQAGEDLIDSVHLFSDSSRVHLPAQVESGQFRPVGHTVMMGYDSDVQWLRVRVRPAPDGNGAVLLIRPPTLDDVRVYVPVAPVHPDGDMADQDVTYRLEDTNWPSALRGYRIHPPEGGADYFIRVASTGSIAINVTALPIEAAVRLSLITDLLQIGYFFATLVLLLWSLRMLAVTQEPLFAWFAAMEAAWLVHNFNAFGYGNVLFPGIERDIQITVFRTSVFVAAMMSIAFHRAFMVRFQPARFALRLFDMQIATMLLGLVIFLLVDPGLGLEINAYAIVAAPMVFLLNAYTAGKYASPGLTTMRVIYTVLSFALLTWVLTLLGVGESRVFSLYGFMIHGVTTGLLMFIILQLHGRNIASAARAAEARIAAMQQQREIEQEKTRTLAKFIDMLSHETRNALAVINMSISGGVIGERQRRRITDSINGLSGVIDRCNQAIRIDSHGQAINRAPCDLVDILRGLVSAMVDEGRVRFRESGRAVVPGDRVLLGVVFGNLIDNALKYSPPESDVVVTLARDANGYAVTVENQQGPAGVPDPAHVFQKYYRNYRAKAQIGSGLGLYIVRGLIGLLGGTIAYEPSDGNVKFKVWLPC